MKNKIAGALIKVLAKLVGGKGRISDGFHTFDEYFEFRKMYNACLINEWAAQGKFEVHKSFRHYDGERCFGGGWFVVVAVLPDGQITNHYEAEDWELFQCKGVEKAMYPFDGHTSSDVLTRLRATALRVTEETRPCGLD